MSAHPSSRSGKPYAGQLVGGRFRITREMGADPVSLRFLALDEKKGVPVLLRLLQAPFDIEENLGAVRDACRLAADLNHGAILKVLGVGKLSTGQAFVTEVPPTGLSLDAHLSGGHGPLPITDITGLAATVRSALDHGPAGFCHGALRPSIIFREPNGSFSIGEFGFASALLQCAGDTGFSPAERWFLAPELRARGNATPESDVFGLAATCWALFAGKAGAPAGENLPSPETPEAVAWVLHQAMSETPVDRFETVSAFVRALERVAPVSEAPSPPRRPDTGAFEVDVDLASIAPPTPVAPPAPRARPISSLGGTNGVPRTAARVAVPPNGAPSAPEPPGNQVNLQQLLAKITENDAPRWMMVKDKLDHGPFSGRELVEMILRGELRTSDGLLNMDTGSRGQADTFEAFSEFFAQYMFTKAAEKQQQALARAETVEKVSNHAKLLGGSAILGGALLLALIALVTLRAQKDQTAQDVDARAGLFERGEIEIAGTAESLPRRGRSGRRAAGRSAGSGDPSSAAGASSYEEAMNRAMNLGDVTEAGSERQLTGGEVAATMNRHVNQLYACVVQELRSGQALNSVQVDLAIAGSGQVLGASARQGSGEFKQCVERRILAVRFPTFPAARMGARYSFRVD